MPAHHVRAVARRIHLVELNVGDEARARVASFDQVVAQNAVFGKSVGQRALEGIHIVDSFANERALLEEILVDIRDCACVRVEARFAAPKVGIARSDPHQALGHARLENAVAGQDPLRAFVKDRAIEGVR